MSTACDPMNERPQLQRSSACRLECVWNASNRILHADHSAPVTDRFLGPRRRFLCVTGRTRIGNFELIRHRGRDKAERMRMHVRTGNAFGLYLRHMASHALASRTAHSMVCFALPASPCAGRWAMLYHDILGIAGSLAPAAARGSPVPCTS